ncbi:MAG: hypothetical protein JNJ80_10135 [Gemmatimonadetes bacterium]|nr:hypothetical protein [Gemmatimonadota bacterium]
MESNPTKLLLLAVLAAVAGTGCREPTEPGDLQGWVLQADATLGTAGQGRSEVCSLRSSGFRDEEATLPVFWAGLPATSFSRIISVGGTVQQQVHLPLAAALVVIEAGPGDSVRIVYSGQLVDTLYGRRITATLANGSWICASTLPGAEAGGSVPTGQWSLEKR